jgi:F0F1-type ATP synthase, delta subunit (mitochondrial oligomycin sensitivity protein)
MNASKRAKRQATQLFRSCLVNGLLDEQRSRRVLQQIVATKPRGFLGILSHFRRLVKLDAARHTAKVESARPLPPELQANVKAGLARVYGAGLGVSFAENAALIGGMRVQVGSDVYDGSVRSRLAALEQSF